MGAKSLGLIILSLWFVLCQGSNHCPRLRSCNCSDFGKIRFKVRCVGLYSVPTAIPSNTAMLNLSGNYLDAVYTGSFGNLTFLSKMDLSRNRLRFIAKDAFENLTSLKVINLEKNFIKGGFYFPESLVNINLNNNEVSFDDLKVILRGLKKLRSLNIDRNRRLGPVLTSDIFAGMVKMECLSMKYCTFEHIESGAFQSMHNLTEIDLSNNLLSHLQPGALEGPGDQLINLFISSNRIRTVAEGTFKRFEKLNRCYLNGNSLKSVPDLTGLTALSNLDLSANRIMDVTRIGKSGIQVIFGLSLSDNQIKSLPENVFHNFSVIGHLDLSFNKLQSIPDDTFAGFKNLSYLVLSFNRISGINRRTFSGLKKLEALMMVKNNLTSLPEDAFAETSLKILFLHNNGITRVHRNSLSGLKHLKSLTLFDNPLRILPDGLFDNSSSNMNLFITCKNLRKLPKETHNSNIQCAPSTSFFYIVSHVAQLNLYKKSMIHSGFVCLPCTTGTIPSPECLNCTLCGAGYYRNFDYFDDVCQPCPAGGFYQDEMGHVETAGCKRCSVGTYVSVQRHPGKSANDCWACPYGTLSNETADHRACKCLHNFYRLDRFGPCSPCPPHGLVCENDTAVLAPNYFWRWSNQSNKNLYKSFVDTTRVPGVECNETFSAFKGSLPKPIKCPYAGSCKGGIDSDCREEYQGNLCATCASGYYLRFHTCLKCPRLIVSLISSVVVIAIFVVVFLMVLWGDSKKTENDRTVADVIMSCFKIVIGFYQVIIGIFSALARVQWPVALISMERCMKLFEGNIFQFAPLSCIYPQLRLDQFFRFILVLSVNASAVSLIFIYLFLKRRLIKKRQGFSESEKKLAVSCLKKSCYRNIFLFLLASYPVTSKQIIQILPLPGACVEHCFTNDKSQCISLLRADYSIKCFTSQHNLFWPIAAAFSVYPLGFPVIVLFLIHKYRQSPGNEEIAFGLKVFFENYEDKFWFWEVTEMYRKLILIALIFLFGPESLSQIGLTVFTVSAFGVAHTFFRPIKDEFEERLQTFVLWVIFFDVCLGAMYTNCEITHGRKRNDSLLVNVLFVVLNSSVLLVALGKGIRYAKFFWKTVSRCLIQCFHIFRHGATFVKNEAFSFLQKLNFAPQRLEGSEREPFLSQSPP